MASTPAYAVLLVGLGAVDLSMIPAMIPRVRNVLTKINASDIHGLALKCLAAATADEVEDLVKTLSLSA
jgi:phosphoenolpyruvate-protein kinase (PTS system EI component)